MKKAISLLLCFALLWTACCPCVLAESTTLTVPEFSSLGDPALLPYMEDTLYEGLVSSLNSDEYFVENVSAVYVSQEYLDELAYNSQANIYFGYTLAELNEQFQGTRYIFTLGENNETVVVPFEDYDDTFERVIQNVAVGTGVILVCVTVSVVTAGAGAYPTALIFACAAKTGTTCALSGAALGAVSAGVVTGLQTGDMDAALKSAALAGSEGFKWGAISGAFSGGMKGSRMVSELKGANLTLSVNDAARIQLESGYPVDVIKGFKTMDQYKICRNAGLKPHMVNGKTALVREIDLNFKDELGTNLEKMKKGLAALDPATKQPYELHHIGQKMDSTLAILTKAEHMQGGNNLIWHEFGNASNINRNLFNEQRKQFWMDLANILEGGVL